MWTTEEIETAAASLGWTFLWNRENCGGHDRPNVGAMWTNLTEDRRCLGEFRWNNQCCRWEATDHGSVAGLALMVHRLSA